MKLQVEYVPITEIKPYKRNAKLHPQEQIEQIKNSMQEFGNIDPIGVWHGEIVEGHGRYEALKQMGVKEIPIIRLDDLTDEQRKAYALVHNKLTMNSDFDVALLDTELAEIETIDMTLLGFDEKEETPQEVVEDDFDEDPPAEPIAKYGDIYQLGRHRLMCGDSTKTNDVECLMGGYKADMVFTDPPYGINVVSDDNKVGADFGVAKKGKYDKVIADETTETAEKSIEILKQICDRLIVWGGNYFLDFLPKSDGWLIWDKRCDSGIRNTFADGEMAWCSFHTPVRIYHQLWNGMIRTGEHEKRVHPTQKPIKMLSEIILGFSKDDDIVLDVFGGSGSTLMACEQTNRRCFMMELDPRYVDVIIERWEKYTGKKAVKLNAD